MIYEKITIINKLGLHTRAAVKLVQIASTFESQVELQHPITGQLVNAKSIMGLLLIGAAYGTTLHLKIIGADEHDARNAIVQLIQDRFGETE